MSQVKKMAFLAVSKKKIFFKNSVLKPTATL